MYQENVNEPIAPDTLPDVRQLNMFKARSNILI